MLQLTPVNVHYYLYSDGRWIKSIPPIKVQIQSISTHTDLDGDGKIEELTLVNGQANIRSNGILLWTSPSSWQVKQTLINDLDRNGQPEVILLVRRPFNPWPVDRWLPYSGRIIKFQDGSGYGCHIILIGWKDHRYKEFWAGSSMAEPALYINAADLNQDGNLELITLESTYGQANLIPGHAIKIWEWNGFGFSLLTSITGKFQGFDILQSESDIQRRYLLAY
jgi:hypothetical protein